MVADARPDDVQDDATDASDGGMTVASAAVCVAITVVVTICWLWVFHWAGGTGGINAYRAIEGLTR